MSNTTIRQFDLLNFLVLVCINLTVLIKHGALRLSVVRLHWVLLAVEIWSLSWLLWFNHKCRLFMDKWLIAPVVHLLILALRILVRFPWVLTVLFFSPLVEHRQLLLKLFVVLTSSLRLPFLMLLKVSFIQTCWNFRTVSFLLFLFF